MEGAAVVLLILILVFYMLPYGIASTRNVQHSGTILFINVVFGWTVLGWLAALLWAIVEKPQEVKPKERGWGDPLPGKK